VSVPQTRCSGVNDYDYNPEEQYVELHHRPESGTRLKNKEAGERYVALSSEVCDALDSYLKYEREKAPDDYDRQPLFTSRHGRPAKSSLRDTSIGSLVPANIQASVHTTAR